MLMITYMLAAMAMSTTCFTRVVQAAGMLVEPSVMWQFQDTGMRIALKPAALTALMSCWLVAGLPHAVSLQMASSVLPRFQPTFIWLATCCAVGRVWDCAEMASVQSAKNAPRPRHIAAEGLRDMWSPWLCRSIDHPAAGLSPHSSARRPGAVYALTPVPNPIRVSPKRYALTWTT